MNLDTPFSSGKWYVNCKTVGEVIDELSKLPRDLPCHQGFEKSVDIVVFNRKTEPVVEFEEGDSWAD